MVECTLSIHEALDSTPSTSMFDDSKKKKKFIKKFLFTDRELQCNSLLYEKILALKNGITHIHSVNKYVLST